MRDLTELPDLIDSRYDGPHTPESVAAAARALPALVRHLVNATNPANSETTLPYASHVHQMLAALTEAALRLHPLIDHLTDTTARHSADPSLTDDRRDRPGSATAEHVLAALRAAQGEAHRLARHLDAARESAAHLGHG